MANVNVDTLNYEAAHRYYLAYYTSSGSEDDQKTGKQVAESKKWSDYITKWQSEDTTQYDIDGSGSVAANKEKDNLAEDGPGNDKSDSVGREAAGGVVGGIAAAAGIGMALAIKTGILKIASNGSPLAAGIYAGLGAVYVIIEEIVRSQAKQSRERQEKYIAKAEKDLQYDFAAAEAKSQEINDMVSAQSALVTKTQEQAKGDVTLSDAVAEATANTNAKVNVAALGQGDATAGKAFEELDGINSEMLESVSEYDSIISEVQTNKDVIQQIKTDLPEFQEARKNDKTTETLFAIGGAAGVLAGAVGLMAAAAYGITAIAGIVLFAVGVILFGVAAVMSYMESSKQKQGEEQAGQAIDKTEQKYQEAESANSNIRENINSSNADYQSGVAAQQDMDKADANANGALA